MAPTPRLYVTLATGSSLTGQLGNSLTLVLHLAKPQLHRKVLFNSPQTLKFRQEPILTTPSFLPLFRARCRTALRQLPRQLLRPAQQLRVHTTLAFKVRPMLLPLKARPIKPFSTLLPLKATPIKLSWTRLPLKVTLTKPCSMLLLLRVQLTKRFWMQPPLKVTPTKLCLMLLPLKETPTKLCLMLLPPKATQLRP